MSSTREVTLPSGSIAGDAPIRRVKNRRADGPDRVGRRHPATRRVESEAGGVRQRIDVGDPAAIEIIHAGPCKPSGLVRLTSRVRPSYPMLVVLPSGSTVATGRPLLSKTVDDTAPIGLVTVIRLPALSNPCVVRLPKRVDRGDRPQERVVQSRPCVV